MAKLIYELNQSLDGYVDHTKFRPSPQLFRHWIERVSSISGIIYGRTSYEIMRYWDEDFASWTADEHAFAAAWRKRPKWVISSTLQSVGPNATLIQTDCEAAIASLKTKQAGEISVAGPTLVGSLTPGLIDEYRIYLHPVVVGPGKPYFTGPRPPLRLIASDRITEEVIRLTYAPA